MKRPFDDFSGVTHHKRNRQETPSFLGVFLQNCSETPQTYDSRDRGYVDNASYPLIANQLMAKTLYYTLIVIKSDDSFSPAGLEPKSSLLENAPWIPYDTDILTRYQYHHQPHVNEGGDELTYLGYLNQLNLEMYNACMTCIHMYPEYIRIEQTDLDAMVDVFNKNWRPIDMGYIFDDY
jgi:hypothetical protein